MQVESSVLFSPTCVKPNNVSGNYLAHSLLHVLQNSHLPSSSSILCLSHLASGNGQENCSLRPLTACIVNAWFISSIKLRVVESLLHPKTFSMCSNCFIHSKSNSSFVLFILLNLSC